MNRKRSAASVRWPLQALLLLALSWGCATPEPVDDGASVEPPAIASGPAWFEERAQASGLVFRHDSGHDDRHLFPEIISGGASLFDMDGDGDLDAYLVQSGSVAEPGGKRAANQLFRNDGSGRFENVSEGSGAADEGYGMGVAAGDYDNDGDVDLYVTNFGPNALLRNDGSGRFENVADAARVGDPSWGTSTAFLDYDADGDLDLFVVNYVSWSLRIEQNCYNRAGLLDYCLPTNYSAPAMDRLFRNEGDGRFTDVTTDAGLQAAYGNGLGIVAGDFDGDGRQDVFVANDTMLNQLWMNQGDGFADESLLRGCALDEHGKAKAGMGTTAGDVDDDGDLDLFVVNLQGQTDSFFRNEDGYFADHTGAIGLGTASRSFTRFGIGLVDFDNDGALDLYQANGRVVKSPEPRTDDPYAESNVLFRGDSTGRFVEVLPRGGTAEEFIATSRAAAFGDIDGDGAVDVLVVNRDGPAQLLRNVAPDRGNWLRFRVLDEHGRDALGATLSLSLGQRRITRDVRAAASYCASSDPRVHVGLGSATRVESVTVRWVDGTLESFGGIDANADVELRRGAGSTD